LLEQLIQNRDLTVDEAAREFEALAAQLGEAATMSSRQLRRWMSGGVESAHPSSRRVAHKLWGYPFAQLIGSPPQPRPPDVVASSVEIPAPDDVVAVNSAAPAASLSEELRMAADESARFVRRAGAVLTSEAVDQMESDVVWLAEQYLRRSPYAMFRPLAMLRREIFGFIDGHPRPEHARELYRLAGLLSAMLAHLSSDFGDSYGVENHSRTAWMCADRCGDDRQRGYIRWVQAQLAYWQGNHERSAELAREGQAYAAADGMLRLVSQEARALAALGNETATSDGLRRAADARESAVDRASAPGVLHFAPGKAAYYAAEAHIALGGDAHLRRAVVDAQASLDLFEASGERSPELVAAAQLDLVAAYVELKDLDSGNEQLAAVLDLPAESRTMPVIERTRRISSALSVGPFSGSRSAARTREQLEQFCAYPAARELPQLPG